MQSGEFKRLGRFTVNCSLLHAQNIIYVLFSLVPSGSDEEEQVTAGFCFTEELHSPTSEPFILRTGAQVGGGVEEVYLGSVSSGRLSEVIISCSR